MLKIKTINVNGKDFECYEIDGHPLKDLIILRQDLSLIDESRLSLAASGEVKGRDKNKILWEGQYVEVSGTYLNLLQAMLLDVGKWGTEYFSKLFKSLNLARTTIEKYDISSHLIATVHELKHGDHNGGGGGDVSISKVADNRLERKPDGLYVRDRLDPDPVAYYLLSRG